MDTFPRLSTYMKMKLEDAKSIAQHSFIVQDSVSHLDLSLCEYSTFKKKVSGKFARDAPMETHIQTEEQSRLHFVPERRLLYDLHLDLPKDKETRLRNQPWIPSDDTASDSKAFHVREITVSEFWYARNINDYLILFLQLSDRKVELLEQVSKVVNMFKMICVTQDFSFCLLHNILCFESKEIGDVSGVLIVVGNHDQFTISKREDILLYQVYGSDSLREDVDKCEYLVNNLMINMEYKFLPILFMYGYLPAFLSHGLHLHINSYRDFGESLYKGVDEGVLSARRNYLLMQLLATVLDLVYYIDGWETARQVLITLWRAIPDPFLSREEVEYAYKDILEGDLFKLLNVFYEEIVKEYPQRPIPRSLMHQSRMVIREIMKDNRQLPDGISDLNIPSKLHSYLRLEL